MCTTFTVKVYFGSLRLFLHPSFVRKVPSIIVWVIARTTALLIHLQQLFLARRINGVIIIVHYYVTISPPTQKSVPAGFPPNCSKPSSDDVWSLSYI